MTVSRAPQIGDVEFPEGASRILELVKETVRTGESSVACGEMLGCIAIATAARLAPKERRQVAVSEITAWSRMPFG